jgi:hypothetical protein
MDTMAEEGRTSNSKMVNNIKRMQSGYAEISYYHHDMLVL